MVIGVSLIYVGSPHKRNFQNLVVTIKETGETLTVQYGADSYDSGHCQIQAIEFADGSSLTYAEILKDNGLHGGDGNDTLYIYDALEGSLYGEGGNDTLNGGALGDSLYGGAGNDTLNGNAGDDVLDGGPGNDTLNGGAGDDTYLFRAGSGQDVINNGGGDDLLRFEDVDPGELWFGKNGDNLNIGLVGTQDKVTVNNWFAGDYKIDAIEAGSMYLSEDQVAQLLQAMASVGAPGGAGGLWTEEQEEALASMLLTCWQSMRP